MTGFVGGLLGFLFLVIYVCHETCFLSSDSARIGFGKFCLNVGLYQDKSRALWIMIGLMSHVTDIQSFNGS
jgi:hypothetical protein